MTLSHRILSSESITEGHPDKLCDQIADAILDETLRQDPDAHVACEVTACSGLIYIMGELSTTAYVDMESVTRKKLEEIGYTTAESGIDGRHCAIISAVTEQSGDIAQGVNLSEEAREGETDLDSKIGAGDQGMMFGYATNETPEYLPAPYVFATKLAKRLAQVRKEGVISHLRPDGKTQVSVEYIDGKPSRIRSILISAQHDPDLSMEKLKEELWTNVVIPTVDQTLLDSETKFFVNPTGRFEIGGPQADAGLTGRKIIADTYGGMAHHGGGAFSGKDPSKVDRSASYYARYAAKNMVAAGLCDRCEIEVAYAIGRAEPFSLDIDAFGTSSFSDDQLLEILKEAFDFRPASIVRQLDLKRPIYSKTAAYGHFGRDEETFTWEKLDRVERLKQIAQKVR